MQNKPDFLGKEKIPKLLFRLSMPSVVAMLVMSLFQLVDTIYVGRGVGSLGIAGITVAFPIIIFLMAIAQMLGVGVSSIISRALGSKDLKKARNSLGNYLTLLIISSTIFIILGNYYLEDMLNLFGATPQIFPYAYDYLKIIFYGIFFLMFAMSANNIIRAQGHAKTSMAIMLSSALTNIILTPIFIFGLDMGMKGAALGTVCSYFFSALAVIAYLFSRYNNIKITYSDLKLKLKIITETIVVGLSSFARQVSMAIMIIVINNLLVIYANNTTIAAYGIVHRVMVFLTMPMFGLILGLQPIIGYNYGADKKDRVIEAITLAIKVTFLVSLSSYAVVMIFPQFVSSLFTSQDELITASSSILRTVFIAFPIVSVYLIAGGVYQSLGKARPALILSLLRQVIILIPLALIFSKYFGAYGIWFAFPISDIVSGMVSVIFLKREIKLLK